MDNTSVPKPTNRRIRRLRSSMHDAARTRLASFVRAIGAPVLPLLIFGVIGVALFASLILKASDDIVFGILLIGCLTALLETKIRNDNRE